jgi:uncharacterized RDD family membrane protein YckC
MTAQGPSTPEWSTQAPGQLTAQDVVRGLPPGVELAGLGRRFGAALLNALLAIVTLGIGWIIWDLVLWQRGQNPGQRILKLRVVKETTGQIPSYGEMFVRNFLEYYLLMGLLEGLLIGIFLLFMPFFGDKKQALWDRMSGTIVVKDENGVLEPARA